MARKHKTFQMKRRAAWSVLGTIGVITLAGLAALTARGRGQSRHPEPQENVSAAHVLHGAGVPHAAGAAESYAVARAIPAVLDGLRCYCACGATLGHRSLLSCFEDEHGALCQVCQDEALIAGDVAARRGSLRDARAAVDARFGPPT